MNFKSYQELVSRIKLGKHLPGAVYIHKTAIKKAVPLVLYEYIKEIIKILNIPHLKWNLIKLNKKDFKVSLLAYPSFFQHSYPALHKSFTIDLETETYRASNYSNSNNPPILHRKETFMDSNHSSVPLFSEITREGEEAGLYEKPKLIGFKESWERLIKRKGYALEEGRLIKKSMHVEEIKRTESKHDGSIQRHLTAINRDYLSSPLQSLARYNYLKKQFSVLDYGCGKGDDVRELEAHEFKVNGWDPVYKTNGKKIKSDIVNLGFVINVIEDRKERDEALQNAYKYAKKILVVSAMLYGSRGGRSFTPYRDGSITSRQTFQKYYSQSDLKQYIENTIKNNAIAISPGTFYVFRDKREEQSFLLDRQKVRFAWHQLTKREKNKKEKIRKTVIEKNKELFEDFWNVCLDLGREPSIMEFEFSEQLRKVAGSHKKALQLIQSHYQTEDLYHAQEARKNDLLVYFALSLFDKRKPLTHLPYGLKQDLKVFFEKYTVALESAQSLLFSIGNPKNITEACKSASMSFGSLDKESALTIHSSYINKLPTILRVYVGCSTLVYGDLSQVDLIKIHPRSGKVSLMIYDDFDGKPLPLLLRRIKINLRKQEIDFFDYGDKYTPKPVYLKSIYLRPDYPNYKKQLLFDEKLKSLSWLNLSGYGPSHELFINLLDAHGLKVSGFRLTSGSGSKEK